MTLLGISLVDHDGRIDCVRAVGNLANLRAAVPGALDDEGAVPSPRAGHDRRRPHPLGNPRPGHRGERPPAQRRQRQINIVLNGIVENHSELRRDAVMPSSKTSRSLRRDVTSVVWRGSASS